MWRPLHYFDSSTNNPIGYRMKRVKCGIYQGGAVGDHMCLYIGGHVYLMFRKSFKRHIQWCE